MPEPVRIVALDHFSEQDRNALVRAGGDRFSWRVVPYWRFRDAANRLFPPAVQDGMEAFTSPRLENERAAYSAWLRREIARIYVDWPFDVFLLPSDTYYYVRSLPEACHELGIPVFVSQKETTLSDYAFEAHAPSVQEHAPFIARVFQGEAGHRGPDGNAGRDGARVCSYIL